MAVVAVLLNNRLYVANVGEHLSGRAGQGWVGQAPLQACAFFRQSAFQTHGAASLSLLRPLDGFPCLPTRGSVPVRGVGSTGWEAGALALVPTPPHGLWLWGSCVACLGLLSGFLFWKFCRLWQAHSASP